MDLDAFDLEGGLGALVAHARRVVPAPARGTMQRKEGRPIVRQIACRLGVLRARLGALLHCHAARVPLRLDHGENVAARHLIAGPDAHLGDRSRDR